MVLPAVIALRDTADAPRGDSHRAGLDGIRCREREWQGSADARLSHRWQDGNGPESPQRHLRPWSEDLQFVATLPIEDPRYVVLVVVDEPQGGNAYGSTVAVPVAKKIIDGLLVIERIPPVVQPPLRSLPTLQSLFRPADKAVPLQLVWLR